MKIGKEQTFTYPLTDDIFFIDYKDQVKKVSVANSSAVDGSINGGAAVEINGILSTDVPISQGESVTITPADIAVVLDGITITAPPGCTLKILIQR